MEQQDTYTEMVSFRINKDLRVGLARLAKSDMRPLASYIRLVLEQHVTSKTTKRKSSKNTD